MKKCKAFICWLLSLCLLGTVCLPALAVHSDDEDEEEFLTFVEIPDDDYYTAGLDDIDYAVAHFGSFENFRNYFIPYLASCAAEIPIGQFNIPASDVSTIHQLLKENIPEAFHMDSFSYYQSEDPLQTLFITYRYTADEYQDKMETIEETAARLTYGITDSMSDMEKALLLYDRLAQYAEYDYDNYLADTIPKRSYYLDGILCNAVGVCNGYAHAFSYLARKVGLTSYYCSSDAMSHAWNIVYIDGIPYHMDVTWGDPTYDRFGQVNHDHFLLSYTTFSAEPSGHNKDGAADYDQTPSSETYANCFWRELDDTYVQSAFVVIGDTVYYALSDENACFTYIKSTPQSTLLDDTDDTVLYTVTDNWRSTGGGYWWNVYTYLSSDGRNLFFNTPTTIMKYNVSTGETSDFYTPEEVDSTAGVARYIYGMCYDGKTLRYEVRNSPNHTGPYAATFAERKTIDYIDPETCGAGNHLNIVTAEAVAATCTTAGKTEAGVCICCGQTNGGEVIPALGHAYKFDYTWNTGHTACTATAVCQNDSTHVVTENGTVSSAITTAASCTTNGVMTYTATFSNTIFDAQIQNETITTAGHDFDYTNAIYTWNDDNTACTVAAKCLHCDATDSATATITIKTTEATCEKAGSTVYTATFAGTDFASDTKTEVTPALSHDYDYANATYTWSTDNTECTATVVCKNNAAHTITVEAKVSADTITPATCANDGLVTYTATFDDERLVAQTKANITIPALSHAVDFKNTEYKWNDDHTECTATAKCTHTGCDYQVTETVKVTVSSNSGDCRTRGSTVYTAAFNNKSFYAQTYKTESAYGAHRIAYKEGTAASCTANGIKAHWECTVCGTVFTDAAGTETVSANTLTTAATGHSYSNGVCQNCGDKCSCNCHTDNGFLAFFWKIKMFFCKLFGTEKTCKCGASHY